MTWRSFFCVVVAAFIYNILISGASQFQGGVLLAQGLVLGLGLSPDNANAVYVHEWLILLVVGIAGGLVGGFYVRGVVSLNGLRKRILGKRRWARVLEATAREASRRQFLLPGARAHDEKCRCAGTCTTAAVRRTPPHLVK